MRVLIILVVFFFCALYDGFTRLDKAPLREIIVYAALMLVSMIILIYAYVKRVDVPSPNYAIENFLDFLFHING
jgi:hypothetical protein